MKLLKVALSVFSLLALLAFGTNGQNSTETTVDNSTLFIYYNFDAIVNNTIIDLSGNGHNGTVVGNPVLETGKFMQALTFHNDVAGDQLVNAGDIDVNSQTFTVTAWVRVLPVYLNTSAFMKVFSKKTFWDETAGYELQYNPADKTITFLSSGSNTGNATNVTLDDNWHHVAAVVNGTTVRIFVDGQDVTTDSSIDAPLPNHGKEFLVGSSSLTPPAGGAWVGSIDEFRIYETDLTPQQIQYVMSGQDIQTSSNSTSSPSPSPSPSSPSPSASPLPSVSSSPTAVPTLEPTLSPSILPSASPSPSQLPVIVVQSSSATKLAGDSRTFFGVLCIAIAILFAGWMD